MWSVQALASQQAAQLQLASQQAAALQAAAQPGPYAGVKKVSKDELPPPQKVGRGAVEPDKIVLVNERPHKGLPQQKGSGKKYGKSGGKGKPSKQKHVPIELTMVAVKGYSDDTTKEELKEHFKEAGMVQSVTILKKDQKACVKFTSDTEAAQAILMFNCSEIKGKMLEVVEWSGPIPNQVARDSGGGAASSWSGDDWNSPMMPMMAMMSAMMMSSWSQGMAEGDQRMHGDKNTMVFVGNLNYNVSWQDLKDHFKAAGKVERAQKMRPKTGCVKFSTAEEAQKAIKELNGSKLKDCEMTVDKWD